MRFRLNGKEYTKNYHPDDRRCCRVECTLACTGILFFLPLVSVPNSRFGRYWANQGLIMLFCELILLLVGFVCSVILGILSMIPFIGIIFNIAKVLVFIALGAVALFGMVLSGSFAARGRAIDLPIVGAFRFIK